MFLLAFIFEFVFIFTVYLIEEKRTQKPWFDEIRITQKLDKEPMVLYHARPI